MTYASFQGASEVLPTKATLSMSGLDPLPALPALKT